MTLRASAAAVDGPHGPLLMPTSLYAPAGEVTLVAGEPGPPLVTLALALGGGVRLDDGVITCHGSDDPAVRRRRVCLVDVPNITEPEPALPVSTVVGEELALAGLPARDRDVRAFLIDHGADSRAKARWETLPAAEHVAWLAELGSQREGVSCVVLTSPDRWGGNPQAWMMVAEDLADRDFTVVVLATHNSLRQLGAPIKYEVGVV